MKWRTGWGGRRLSSDKLPSLSSCLVLLSFSFPSIIFVLSLVLLVMSGPESESTKVFFSFCGCHMESKEGRSEAISLLKRQGIHLCSEVEMNFFFFFSLSLWGMRNDALRGEAELLSPSDSSLMPFILGYETGGLLFGAWKEKNGWQIFLIPRLSFTSFSLLPIQFFPASKRNPPPPPVCPFVATICIINSFHSDRQYNMVRVTSPLSWKWSFFPIVERGKTARQSGLWKGKFVLMQMTDKMDDLLCCFLHFHCLVSNLGYF